MFIYHVIMSFGKNVVIFWQVSSLCKNYAIREPNSTQIIYVQKQT